MQKCSQNSRFLFGSSEYLQNSLFPSQAPTQGVRRPQARKRTRTRKRRGPARQQTSDPLWRSGPARDKMAATRTAADPKSTRETLAAVVMRTSCPLLDSKENLSAVEDIKSSSTPCMLRTTRTDSQIHADTRTTAKTPERTRTKIDAEAERRSLCGGAGTGQSHERGAAERSTPRTRTRTAWRGRTKRTGMLTDTKSPGGKTRGAGIAHRGDTDSHLKEDRIWSWYQSRFEPFLVHCGFHLCACYYTVKHNDFFEQSLKGLMWKCTIHTLMLCKVFLNNFSG